MEKLNQQHFRNLFELYVSGKCTPQQRDEFFDLYARFKDDSALEALLDELYSQIQQASGSASYINYKGEIDLAADVEQPAKVVAPGKRRRVFAYGAAAAGLLLLGVAAWMFSRPAQVPAIAYSHQDSAQVKVLAAYTTIQTGNHERKVIVLSDSTRIVLNAASELRYPSHFNGDQREVYLEGEAFFEVSQAAEWPFIIHAPGNIKTTVLGTSFNIKAYAGRRQAVVSVVSGKVKISSGKKDLSTLEKGEELRLVVPTGEISKRRNIDNANILAWQSGDIVFNDETLADILKDLQIYYGVNIQLKNEQLANLLITTGFQKNTSIESALENISALANARYAKEKENYVVY
ncbi:ferric-dicitrate binding protein FerR (iron transport regulator) [Chitinophaga terrae (ex Kim and Jung 2007)]|uniref:FecR family protein n=1 Tax=Chitinophaga terrae (ex Kim and Jung 2007) TaxID=408074 RepID=UPI00278684A1|nr:FecR domain-containing protein [Chitinophaga terrae (ex Kim and Jung 2007)]MDQ0106786.1 ferric-dicitrate binding protein FerR (iron transport regulator) [Chitinophaga terrae (ex Kim and Jung 2007)]